MNESPSKASANFKDKYDLYLTLSKMDEQQQKSFVYTCLGNRKIWELEEFPTSFSDTEKLNILKNKVREIAAQRETEILKFVEKLNQFGQRKDDLALSNPNYGAKRQIREEISQNSFMLKTFIVTENNESIAKYAVRLKEKLSQRKTKESFHSTISGFYSKWKNAYLTFIHEVQNRMSDCGDNDAIMNEFVKSSKVALKLMESMMEIIVRKGTVYFDQEIIPQLFSDLPVVLHEPLEKWIERTKISIKYFYPELKYEGPRKYESSVENIFSLLNKYQSVCTALEDDEEYKTLRQTKSALQEEFEILSSFCKPQELLEHKKMTNESSQRIRQWMTDSK